MNSGKQQIYVYLKLPINQSYTVADVIDTIQEWYDTPLIQEEVHCWMKMILLVKFTMPMVKNVLLKDLLIPPI